MVIAQVSDIIRLGSFVIPVVILLIAGQVVRFDPNRRLSRPSVCRNAIRKFEKPWGYFLAAFRGLLTALLLLDVAEIALTSLHDRTLLALLPSWAIFQNPNVSAIYATLALLATWFVGYLKRHSMEIFDQVFASHLDFADWRTADVTRDSRPALHLRNWRYEMKWNFKTNPEPIDALHMRMIFECATYDEFEQRILHNEYPKSFESLLKYSPYGRMIGDNAKLMREDILHGLYQAPTLWTIWEGRPNPYDNNAVIESPTAMATMLYAELRGLLVCPTCRALPELVQQCERCHGSGARVGRCAQCDGTGQGNKNRRGDVLRCKQCGGIGLDHQPIPITFMNRLQYLWMARNVDLLKRLFPVWLSNLTYLSIFASAATLFLVVSLLSQSGANVDLLVQAFLFGEAVLLGMLSGAIVFVFAVAFNGSGMLLTSYPLSDTVYGNHIWIQLRNLLGVLTFGSLLIDTTFAMSQFLFAHNINVALLVLATTTVTLFVIVISFGGFYTIHTAMRDTKQSLLNELATWFYQQRSAEDKVQTDKEEDFFKEIRQLQEWPIDIVTSFGIVSGVVIPIALALGGPLWGYLLTLFRGQ